MKKIKLFLILFLMILIPTNVWAINEVNIYFFHSNSCDICKQEEVYLDALKERYPNIRIYQYEVSDSYNNELMKNAKNMYNQMGNGVPFTVIGDKAYLGFSQSKKALFQKTVYEYSKTTYKNELGKILGISYRTDLDGEVKEYKDNSEYQIEEKSNKPKKVTKKEKNFDKYKISIYLVGVGFILAVLALIIHLFEKRGRIWVFI